MHARSSIGMMLPLNAPVNCEAEVEIDGALRPNPEEPQTTDVFHPFRSFVLKENPSLP